MMCEGDVGSRAIQRAGNGQKAVQWVVTVLGGFGGQGPIPANFTPGTIS